MFSGSELVIPMMDVNHLLCLSLVTPPWLLTMMMFTYCEFSLVSWL